MENIQKIYIYKVDHDLGINPNPFGEFCTLGSCKPILCSSIYISYGEQLTDKGVWVIGIGGANLGKAYGRVIYAMQVTEAIPREKYSEDARFNYKVRVNTGEDWHKKNWQGWKANGDWRCCGDRPAKNKFVLVSDRFTYWGCEACKQEERFIDLLNKPNDNMRGHRVNFSSEVHERIKNWLNNNFNNEGCIGRPVFSAPNFAAPEMADIAAITEQVNNNTSKGRGCK